MIESRVRALEEFIRTVCVRNCLAHSNVDVIEDYWDTMDPEVKKALMSLGGVIFGDSSELTKEDFTKERTFEELCDMPVIRRERHVSLLLESPSFKLLFHNAPEEIVRGRKIRGQFLQAEILKYDFIEHRWEVYRQYTPRELQSINASGEQDE